MAKAKPISSLGKDIKGTKLRFQLNSVAQVRRVAVAVGTEIINATPVDTGRAKGNWLPSLGAPTSTMNWSDSATFGAASSISAIRAVSGAYKGGSLFLANNLPYINRLNNGWSQQQSVPGWIERISEETFNRLRKRWWK